MTATGCTSDAITQYLVQEFLRPDGDRGVETDICLLWAHLLEQDSTLLGQVWVGSPVWAEADQVEDVEVDPTMMSSCPLVR